MPDDVCTPLSSEKAYMEISYNIAYYRRRNGLTQEELAERIGISRSHMSAIEAPNLHHSFSLEILLRIADALGIEPCRLLDLHQNGN